jgi:hypothetical protein
MSKKRLDTTAIQNELSGGSAFFPNYRKETPSPAPEPVTRAPETEPAVKDIKRPRGRGVKGSDGRSGRGTMVPRHHDTMTPRLHDTTIPQIEEAALEVVRRAVKQIGKEAATHRFTEAEKSGLRDIEYDYRRKGIRTSENEITRIAINYLIEDYQKHGDRSILATILERLNA